MEPNELILDIETIPNLVELFQLRVYSGWVPPTAIAQERIILCAAWKWRGGKRVYSARANVRDLDDTPVLEKLSAAINKSHSVIAHNGKKFDIKWINGRLLLNGMKPIKPPLIIDTLSLAKQKFNLNAYNLDYLAQKLKVGGKIKTDYSLWKACMTGNKAAMAKMLRYNKNDVVLLEKVYEKLEPFFPALLNKAHFEDDIEKKKRTCPSCRQARLAKSGLHYTRAGVRQQWKCWNCGAWAYSPLTRGLPR